MNKRNEGSRDLTGIHNREAARPYEAEYLFCGSGPQTRDYRTPRAGSPDSFRAESRLSPSECPRQGDRGEYLAVKVVAKCVD